MIKEGLLAHHFIS